jgi:hypothetical protein
MATRDAATKKVARVEVGSATLEAGPASVAASATYNVADGSVPVFVVSTITLDP